MHRSVIINQSRRRSICRCLSLEFRLLVASEGYHHTLCKKKTSDALTETDKLLPIDTLGLVMINHGGEFGGDSSFGKFLRGWK